MARALVAFAFAGSAATLGLGATTAWADDPTPAADPASSNPLAADPPADPPAAPPTVGSWIIGGTLLEGTKAAPVAKPVAKPVARTAVAPARRSTTSTRHSHAGTVSPSSAATAPDGATALPFTGGHIDALLPTGVALLVGGVVLTVVTRPRRTALRSA